MVDSTILVICSYFRMDCYSICKIVVHIPIYYEICYDGRHVYYETTYFQLVFYADITNFKDLSVRYRRGDEVWEQSGLVFNILEQEHVYLFHSNFLLTTLRNAIYMYCYWALEGYICDCD